MSTCPPNAIIVCYDETVSRLKSRPRKLSFRRIAEATGLSQDWLAKLSRGEWGDPGILKIAKLHDYLSSQDNSDGNNSNDMPARPIELTNGQ